jgi:phosphatidylinositol alpha-1,6-mannosyltransferase
LKPDLTLVTSAEAQSAVSLLPLSVPVDFWLVMHGTEIQQLIKDNGQGLETRLVRKVYRRMVSNARGVICVSEFTRKLLVASMPSVNGRAFVVHPGVAGPCLEPAPPADVIAFRRKLGLNGPVLLTVGRLIREKGHDVVLRALADVVPEIQSVVYLIVGKGPERPFLERLAHQLNIQRNVVFLGEVDDTLLPVVYGVADIFVMASGPGERVEGFGLVLAEAGAQGKPVIAGRTGGVPEAVRDKQNGILVDPFSPDQVRDAIFDLLRNPETARLMGENGRALVGQKFNARTMAEALLGVPGMPTSQFISEERR